MTKNQNKTIKEEQSQLSYLDKIEKVMKDLQERGAKVFLQAELTDVGIEYFVLARWKTGKKWLIKVV